jgi:hypothetical protein
MVYFKYFHGIFVMNNLNNNAPRLTLPEKIAAIGKLIVWTPIVGVLLIGGSLILGVLLVSGEISPKNEYSDPIDDD